MVTVSVDGCGRTDRPGAGQLGDRAGSGTGPGPSSRVGLGEQAGRGAGLGRRPAAGVCAGHAGACRIWGGWPQIFGLQLKVLGRWRRGATARATGVRWRRSCQWPGCGPRWWPGKSPHPSGLIRVWLLVYLLVPGLGAFGTILRRCIPAERKAAVDRRAGAGGRGPWAVSAS